MTTLSDYESAVYNLIQAPSSPTPLVPVATVDSAINTARGQLALDAECVREYGTLTIVPGQQQYNFTSIVLPAVGVQGVINVRMATYAVGAINPGTPVLSGGPGQVISTGPGTVLQTGPSIPTSMGNLRINAREWEWFNNYVISQPAPLPAPPKYWAQFAQGANGTLWVNFPDTQYILFLDTVCFPSPLIAGGPILSTGPGTVLSTGPGTVLSTGSGIASNEEAAIPYSWTDAVPYYAAWQILMSLQRQADANAMLQRYKEWVGRARQGATPSVLPHQYEQVPDPTIPAKLGLSAAPQQQQQGATQ